MSDKNFSKAGNELARYTDELLNRAVSMCGSLADAADITQDALLCALKFMHNDPPPRNMRAWLYTVLKRRYYDHLRKKYRCPAVSLEIAEDIPFSGDPFSGIEQSEEAEQIRRSLSLQTELYRNVLVRFYMRGESVRQIAEALAISENTVKSRLNSGRKKVRKEFEAMEKYTEASYSPKSMWISCSGSCGTNNEPFSLVADDDIIAQNLLILAYNRPVTIPELSELRKLSDEYALKLSEKYEKEYSEVIRGRGAKLPPHLKSVPGFMSHMWCANSMAVLIMKKAMEDGLFLRETDHPVLTAYIIKY